MISLKDEIQNYPPINLKAFVEDDSQISDDIKTSIELYNNAIESLKIDSEDIAIIELKKAISINPGFYEAMNLLGLCYVYINDHEKAAEVFNKVVSAEKNSVRALGYLNKLNRRDDPTPVATAAKKTSNKRIFKEKNGGHGRKIGGYTARRQGRKPNVLTYLICFGAGIFLMLMVNVLSPKEEDPSAAIEEIQQQMREEINVHTKKYENLKIDYDNLVVELEEANEQLAYKMSVIKLYEAENLFLNNNYEEAADKLLLMKTIEFEGEDKKRLELLYEEVMPLAAAELFNRGYNLGEVQNNHEEAVEVFSKIEAYVQNFDRLDEVLYYMGKSHQALNDFDRAKALYNRIIEEMPQSSFVRYAGYRLNEMPS